MPGGSALLATIFMSIGAVTYASGELLGAAVFAGAALLVVLVRHMIPRAPPRAFTTAGGRRGLRAIAVLAGGAALAAYLAVAIAILGAAPYHSDAVVAVHAGAERVLRGQHPYAGFDLVAELRRFGLPEAYATPDDGGARLRSLQYPVLAVLVPAPFIALGLGDIRYLFLAEVIATFLVVLLSVDARFRAVALACCVLNAAVLLQFVDAGVDPLWALLIGAAWALRRSGPASAVLLGLAISARQPAWLIAPFVIVWAWHRYGARQAATRAAIAAAVALAIHLPFLVTAPSAVIDGITAPALQPLEPWGVGPAKLAASGSGPLLPRGAYLALSGAAYLVALAAFALRRARGALSLPLIPLWLSWRALISYFAFVPLFLLIDDDGDYDPA